MQSNFNFPLPRSLDHAIRSGMNHELMQLDSLQFLGIGNDRRCVYWGSFCERGTKRRCYLAAGDSTMRSCCCQPSDGFSKQPSFSFQPRVYTLLHPLYRNITSNPDFLLAIEREKLSGKSPIKKGSATRDVGVHVRKDLRFLFLLLLPLFPPSPDPPV